MAEAGGVVSEKKVDLTGFNYLKLSGEVTDYSYSDCKGLILAISSSNAWGSRWYPASNTGLTNSLTDTTLTIDIRNLTGSYYVFAGFNQSEGNIYRMWLE